MKKIILGLAVVAMAASTSAFTIKHNKLAPGDFRFYNLSQQINDPNQSNYVYRSDLEMCSSLGDVCSEVWNIGTTTPPADNTLLSDITTAKNYVGLPEEGTYDPN